MTTQEFSNEFDILYNNISSNQAPGLNEYEKSVLLTKSQEDIIRELYSGKNVYNDSLEKTEEVRRYLSPLICTSELTDKVDGLIGVSDNSVFFNLPDKVWFITYEAVILDDENAGCHNGEEILVTPVTQDEYYKLKNNPFRRASTRRAIRLDLGQKDTVEIISDYNISSYKVRYLSKPNPIILEDLGEELSINGKSEVYECELNPVIHRLILVRAVNMAKSIFAS